MSIRTLDMTDELYRYLLSVSLRELPLLRQLREETATLPNAQMQTSPEQGQLLHLIVKLLSARAIIEIGVFTGYSSLWMALALEPGGKIVACDTNEAYTRIARRYWRDAGVESLIDLRLAPADETLDELTREGKAGHYDLVYIDADKGSYLLYYEKALRLLRTGGVVAVDNVLWSGRVVNPANTDPDTHAIDTFNRRLATDERIDLSMIPIGDGLTLARKR